MQLRFKKLGTPLLIVGDNPSLPGGLSRIGRDLATLACTLPEFRVGYLGRGDGNRRMFPFVVYPYHESYEWGQDVIREVWQDFSGGEDGLILTTDDPSRRTWFADPALYPTKLEKFLGEGRNFRKLGYFPLDSTGPDPDILGIESRQTLAGYDKVLIASEWGKNLAFNSGRRDADWLPHGFFPDKFKLNPSARKTIVRNEAEIWVGSVMANQSRKDFPVLFEMAAILKKHWGNKFRLWLHTNAAVQYWNVYALAADYGIQECLDLTVGAADELLALRYAACDCTVLPSAGEGFGLPIVESMACGTPCVVTDYAAGQEWVKEDCRVRPVAFRVDTSHNVRRAVLSGHGFANAVIKRVEARREDWDYISEQTADSVSHLAWPSLRFLWERWFRECLK